MTASTDATSGGWRPQLASRLATAGSVLGRWDQRPPRAVVLAASSSAIGALLLVAAYHHAATSDHATDQLTFALYWMGFLAGMLPAAALACAPRADQTSRMFGLVALGLFGTLPRLLRDAGGPVGADEYAHLRQILETYDHGDVGHASPLLPITQYFPGLHQVISALAHLTGLPVWSAALAVIVLAHLLSVAGVYVLVGALGAPSPGPAVGAVVYLLNPSWVLFDTSVAYESLALPLLIWCLAGTMSASRVPPALARRRVAAAGLAAVTVPLVHHLTAIVMCVLLVALALVGLLSRRGSATGPGRPIRPRGGTRPAPADAAGEARGEPRELLWPRLTVLACGIGSTAWWFHGHGDLIVRYLSPALVRGWAQLRRQLTGAASSASGSGQTGGGRSLFSGSQLPLYEVAAGLVFPLLLFAVALLAAAVLRRHRRRLNADVWLFAALGACFFASLPALFTAGGSEGAHRSWAVSFIGLSVLFGTGYGLAMRDRRLHGQDRPGDAPLVPLPGRLRGRQAQLGLVGLLLAVLFVGSTAVSAENASTRFPGPPTVGDDARSINPHGLAVSDWIAQRAPADTPVLADRFASLELGSVGRMATLSPSPTFPVWDLYLSAAPVSERVLRQVLEARIRYIVVDSRMATTRPALGFWFTGDEPGAGGMAPYPPSAIARFDCLPWLTSRYVAGPLTVYEVDREVLSRTLAGSCPTGVVP